MRIGIFEGKKAQYNHAILKVLTEKGLMKEWEIAKNIAKGNMEKTQDVYSILIRKHGRLKELLEKEYISRLPDKRFTPTFKGIIAYLLTEKNPKISESYEKAISQLEIPEKFEIPFINIPITITKDFLDEIKEISIEQLLELKQFILETLFWIDLDAISNEELAILLPIRINKTLMNRVLELLSKFGKP